MTGFATLRVGIAPGELGSAASALEDKPAAGIDAASPKNARRLSMNASLSDLIPRIVTDQKKPLTTEGSECFSPDSSVVQIRAFRSRNIFREMTRRPVSRRDFPQGRLLFRADLLAHETARMKAAGGRRIGRIRHIAGKHNALLSDLRIWLRNGREQRHGIRMPRM